MTILSFATRNTTLFIEDYRCLWIFGFTDTVMMYYDTKRIERGQPFGRTETYTHPDFNDDGSFKRAAVCTDIFSFQKATILFRLLSPSSTSYSE